MSKIDQDAVPLRRGNELSAAPRRSCLMRERRRLGDAGGLTRFGVNLLTLQPGVWSSQRHWHSDEDEFVWVVEGEVVLIADAGEETLRQGDCAAFKAGEANGHKLINRSDRPAKVLEVGNRSEKDRTVYADIDMVAEPGEDIFRRGDGTPYPQT